MKKIIMAGLCLMLAGFMSASAECKNTKTSQKPTKTPVAQQVNFIGDSNSKKYHTTTCKRAPKQMNTVFFDSPMSAKISGYKPCKKCKPIKP